MKISLALLVYAVASGVAVPLQDTLNARLFPRNKDALPVSTETGIVTGKDATNQPAKKQSEKTDSGTKESKSSWLASIPSQDNNRAEGKPDVLRSLKQSNEGRDKVAKKNRRHKAIFVNYPIVQQLPYPDVPYDVDYGNNNFDNEDETVTDADNFQESNIFYIRLPPTPYMFVPGLGYISQPPTYSTSSLRRPHVPFAKPGRPKPSFQQPVNPFIKLPIDFVSNGKPTSVYQWQKKTSKKPTDSPITNLDSLSAEFVSNGKPTTVYQWQSNLKPAKKPDDLVNNLDKGPYTFNGKPTSFFLLKKTRRYSRLSSESSVPRLRPG
ncbi:hypothetical protein WN48_04385 [Eufriesea mexicana]|uniref:uncharacterized protein LOC108550200 n=1 Tax=Eufriesea mexicana TaxID=516756 RepID=UPI00083BDA42|nr:PREDICTED: uncharacterized protein LOC108550200 [Eufriesea mexicana]OAD55732.1 hypothetical protein WN48_04385 [Eufriesea mexicana]